MSEAKPKVLPQALIAAMAVVPSDPNVVPPFWQPVVKGVLVDISSALEGRGSMVEILHIATMPLEAFQAWAKALPPENEGRKSFEITGMMRQQTQELEDALQRSLKRGIQALETKVIADYRGEPLPGASRPTETA